MNDYDKEPQLISKYVWVVNAIRRRGRLSFEEMNEMWLRDMGMSGGVEISKRTFHRWTNAIREIFNLTIVNENQGKYRYYIENEDDISGGGMQAWLYNTFSTNNALNGCKEIKDRIVLENIPSGQQFLQPIIEAMKENRVVTITYHNYWRDEAATFDVEPYCVKLFRQRWYVVAQNTNPDYAKRGPMIYSLDRIKELNTTNETFAMPQDWNANEYFSGCFGIIADRNVDVQTIKLKVSAGQANYMRSLPIHTSQREIERDDEYSTFSLRLRPTFDFIQELLWNGEDVEVLEPATLRKEMADKVKRMSNKYKGVKK